MDEPWKDALLNHLADTQASIFFFNGHGGFLPDDPETIGIVPNSPGPPTPLEYWVTPAHVADAGEHSYKLVILHACRSAEIDRGQAWIDAFNADAFVGWDHKAWDICEKVYTLAFFKCLNSTDPLVYKETAQDAHDYALSVVLQNSFYKTEPAIGEVICEGDAIIPPPWRRKNF